jgi:undecaprenyl diphosphate synthase
MTASQIPLRVHAPFKVPRHVAIIMDGNGRWATSRQRPRSAGHRAGVEALTRVVRAAPEQGIETLTVFAFSSANWRRPAREVQALMQLLAEYLDSETEELVRDGVRLSILGRRDRLPPALVAEIERSEAATQFGDTLHLRVAIDYSARDTIWHAACGASSREDFTARLTDGAPDVDLLIRTSGEQRLSDFLLWECAFAELYFTGLAWPEFGEADLAEAMAAFRVRNRTFGAVPATVV